MQLNSMTHIQWASSFVHCFEYSFRKRSNFMGKKSVSSAKINWRWNFHGYDTEGSNFEIFFGSKTYLFLLSVNYTNGCNQASFVRHMGLHMNLILLFINARLYPYWSGFHLLDLAVAWTQHRAVLQDEWCHLDSQRNKKFIYNVANSNRHNNPECGYSHSQGCWNP